MLGFAWELESIWEDSFEEFGLWPCGEVFIEALRIGVFEKRVFFEKEVGREEWVSC